MNSTLSGLNGNIHLFDEIMKDWRDSYTKHIAIYHNHIAATFAIYLWTKNT